MKSNASIVTAWRRNLRRLAGVTALVTLWAAGAAQAAGPSPVGVWDCVMSGARDGLAYITFSNDNTFTIAEVLVPKAAPKPPEDNGRGVIGESGRGTETSSSPTLPPHTNLFGGELASGTWFFDPQGRTTGFFTEIGDLVCTTNTVPYTTPVLSTNTSPDGSIVPDGLGGFCSDSVIGQSGTNEFIHQTVCYNNVVSCTAITNQISFSAKVVPGKRLTMMASTPGGKVTYQGVPAVTLADISGTWSGVKSLPGPLYFAEQFTMTNVALNFYDVQGTGPGYSYTGVAILSSKKKIAFALSVVPGDNLTRAVIGPFNTKKNTATLKGVEQEPLADAPRVKVKIAKQ